MSDKLVIACYKGDREDWKDIYKPTIFALFHLDRSQLLDKMNYVGSKEHARGVAMDNVVKGKLVTVRAAVDGFGRELTCVSFGFDKCSVPAGDTYKLLVLNTPPS